MHSELLGIKGDAMTLPTRIVAAAKQAWFAVRRSFISARRWPSPASSNRPVRRVVRLITLLLLASGVVHAAPVDGTIKAFPVIIDTDVGDDIDDAFALAVALSDPRLNVIGITTAWGDTRTRTLLVRRLLTTLGRRNVIVAEGPATPGTAPFTQRQWASGAADSSAAPDAIEFLREEVTRHPGEITLIALAPLSNLQALSDRDPAAISKFRQIVIMAGSIYFGYEKNGAIPVQAPSAEYNVAAAPHSFATLLAAGVPIKLFPLDSTQIKFDEVRRDRLFGYGSPVSDALTLLYHQWRLLNSWGQITPTLFDVVPVAWLLDPRICNLVPLRIGVGNGGYTRVEHGIANVTACLDSNQEPIQKLIIDTLAPEPRHAP
jgi:inosine-uridine nucleoside N-ribohydrolase